MKTSTLSTALLATLISATSQDSLSEDHSVPAPAVTSSTPTWTTSSEPSSSTNLATAANMALQISLTSTPTPTPTTFRTLERKNQNHENCCATKSTPKCPNRGSYVPNPHDPCYYTYATKSSKWGPYADHTTWTPRPVWTPPETRA